jgi:hypothetical protein
MQYASLSSFTIRRSKSMQQNRIKHFLTTSSSTALSSYSSFKTLAIRQAQRLFLRLAGTLDSPRSCLFQPEGRNFSCGLFENQNKMSKECFVKAKQIRELTGGGFSRIGEISAFRQIARVGGVRHTAQTDTATDD